MNDESWFPTFDFSPGGEIIGVTPYGGESVPIAEVPGFGAPMEAGAPTNHIVPVPVRPPTYMQPIPTPVTARAPAAAPQVPYVGAPAVTNGIITNGIITNGIMAPPTAGQGIEAVPTALPAVIAGAAMILPRIAGRFSLGFLKGLVQRYGPMVVKAAIRVLAFNEILDLIGIGAPDGTMVDVAGRKKKKRYGIGSNPRVSTLAKVSRHCKRMLKRHEKVIREFLPKPARMPARALAGTYLSTAEKRALRD